MITACTNVIMLSSRSKIRHLDHIMALPISEKYTLVAAKGTQAELLSCLCDQGAEIILA